MTSTTLGPVQIHWSDAPLNDTNCTACPLHEHARCVGVHWRGSPNPDVLAIGMAPGPQEDELGRPFVGPSGQLLQRALAAAGFSQDAIAYSNVVQCVPWEDPAAFPREVRDPTPQEVFACQSRLLREIVHLRPKVIVALGGLASHYLLGKAGSKRSTFKVTKERGKLASVKIAGHTYPVVCALHPAAVLRSPAAEPQFVNDLRTAYRVMEGSYNQGLPETVVARDTFHALQIIDECLQAYRDGKTAHVSFDLETTGFFPWEENARILGIALAHGPGRGYYIPVDHHGVGRVPAETLLPYTYLDREKVIDAFRRLLLEVPVSNQNIKFDLVWIRHLWNIEPREVYADPLIMSHLLWGELRDRQNSLKVLARDFLGYPEYEKHLKKYLEDIDSEDYSLVPLEVMSPYAGVDAEASWRLVELFLPHIVEEGLLVPFRLSTSASLTFSDIEVAGVAVDVPALDGIRQDYVARMRKTFRALLDDPKVQRYLDEQDLKMTLALQSEPAKKTKKATKPFWRDALERYYPTDLDVKELIKVIGFNPNSAPLVSTVLFDGYRIHFQEEWQTTKGDRSVKDTVLKEIDAQLPETHPGREFLSKIREFRGDKKILSSYLNKLPSYVRQDGTLQVKYLITGTFTGRLSTRDFSLHTMPKEGKSPLKRAFISRWRDPADTVMQRLRGTLEGRLLPWMQVYPEHGGGLFVSMDYCLTGDTPVITIDGIMPMSDVVEKMPPVLSCSETGELAFRDVTRAACIGEAPVYKVLLEDGSTVRCTADHKWMDYYGQMVETKNLFPGQRLMHVKESYAGPTGQYKTWYVKTNRNYKYQHRLVSDYLHGPTPDGFEVDHIDGNPSNSVRSNIRLLPKAENRGHSAQRWWDRATQDQRTGKLGQLAAGTRRRGHVGENNPRWGTGQGQAVKCPQCGQERYRHPSQTYEFCSRECYWASKRVEVQCPGCGTTCVKRASEVKRGRCYCSRSCYEKVRTGQNHKVVSVEYVGVEAIYQITVPGWATYVLANGLVSGNSQLELRILSSVAKDDAMIQAFVEGKDLHQFVASRIFYPSAQKLASLTPRQVWRSHCYFASVGAYQKFLLDRGMTRLLQAPTEKEVPAGPNKTKKVKLDHAELHHYPVDLQQLDLDLMAVAAFLSLDPTLYDQIRYEAVIKSQRSFAKAVSFGLVYGQSPEAMAKKAEDMTEEEAKALIDEYFALFPRVAEWIEEQHATVLAPREIWSAGGMIVTYSNWSPVNRVRHFPLAGSMLRGERNSAKRGAQNFPIQSGASELAVAGLQMAEQHLRDRELLTPIVGMVHDSVLFDLYPGEALDVLPLAKRCLEKDIVETPMFSWASNVPIQVDIDLGESWGTAVGVKKVHARGMSFSGPPEDAQRVLELLDRSYKVTVLSSEEKQTKEGARLSCDIELDKLPVRVWSVD